VEGAEQGDALVIHLVRLTPNRPGGYSHDALAPHVVDPEYVRGLSAPARVEWHLDNRTGIATLAEPLPGLERLRLPLRPMLGCFGVAPSLGQAISAATSGCHGGNMDYWGFVAGVSVTFPVFEPGALFFLGDGHAVQGDGEIAGTGIETSFEVEFAVDLRESANVRWPRGEDDEWIFTVGNARPLDQALQHATTEMLRWLESDYGLDHRSASVLMSQSVRYDLGNVFDPAYTMVCKLPKRLLS
jgi:acetamidase/formamidase